MIKLLLSMKKTRKYHCNIQCESYSSNQVIFPVSNDDFIWKWLRYCISEFYTIPDYKKMFIAMQSGFWHGVISLGYFRAFSRIVLRQAMWRRDAHCQGKSGRIRTRCRSNNNFHPIFKNFGYFFKNIFLNLLQRVEKFTIGNQIETKKNWSIWIEL